MRPNKILLTVSIGLLSLMLMVTATAAEVKIFTHTVKQPFGGSQSPDDARIGAVAKAKREVLEKAGTYLESLTVVKNNMVESDEILALAAGVLNTEIISQENYATEDAFGVIITARIQVDTSVLEERIEKLLADQTLLEKNKEAQQRIDELLAINQKLEEENRNLTASSSPQQQEDLRKQFQAVGQGLTAVELLQNSLSSFKMGKFADPGQALEYLNQAIDLDPDNVRAYSLRGLANLQLNRPDDAVSDCSRAVRLKPDSDRVYITRAYVYHHLGRHKLAINDFTRAIRLNPKSNKAYTGRGAALIKSGDRVKACDDFKKACRLGFCQGLRRAVKQGFCRQPGARGKKKR